MGSQDPRRRRARGRGGGGGVLSRWSEHAVRPTAVPTHAEGVAAAPENAAQGTPGRRCRSESPPSPVLPVRARLWAVPTLASTTSRGLRSEHARHGTCRPSTSGSRWRDPAGRHHRQPDMAPGTSTSSPGWPYGDLPPANSFISWRCLQARD